MRSLSFLWAIGPHALSGALVAPSAALVHFVFFSITQQAQPFLISPYIKLLLLCVLKVKSYIFSIFVRNLIHLLNRAGVFTGLLLFWGVFCSQSSTGVEWPP